MPIVDRRAEDQPCQEHDTEPRLRPLLPARDVERQQGAGGDEPAAERRSQRIVRTGECQEEVAHQGDVERAAPVLHEGENPGADPDDLEIAEERRLVRDGGRQQRRREIRACQRPDRERFDLVVQRDHRHDEGRGGEQDHAEAAIDERVGTCQGPQAQIREPRAGADQ